MSIKFTKDENKLIDDCYALIIQLTTEAGPIAVKGFAEVKKTVKTKSASWDLVTEYDKSIEEFLIKGILNVFPNHKFIGEETTTDLQLTDEPTWIIDPIDGTTNFVHGVPLIGISVAFVLRKELAIGIVSNPLRNEFFRCRKDDGAFLNDTKIFSSKVETLDQALYVHEPSFVRFESVKDKNLKRVIKFASVCQGFRSFGACALTLAYIACGSVDGYQVDDIKPWDIAAGALLIKEAGGSVYHTDGTPFDFMTGWLVCAGTEKLCQLLIDGIKESDKWTLSYK